MQVRGCRVSVKTHRGKDINGCKGGTQWKIKAMDGLRTNTKQQSVDGSAASAVDVEIDAQGHPICSIYAVPPEQNDHGLPGNCRPYYSTFSIRVTS